MQFFFLNLMLLSIIFLVKIPKDTEKLKFAIPIARNALNTHEWVKLNIPNGQSGLALELFTLIGFTNLIFEPLSLKVLFHSMSYSEAGIRKQLRRLITDGWVSLEANSNDKRVKKIIASAIMMEVFLKYVNMLNTPTANLSLYILVMKYTL